MALMPVGDKTVEKLIQLSKLRSLNLQLSRITDAGLDRLAELPDLQSLDIQETKVSREAINRFKSKRPTVRLIGMFR